MDQYQMTIWLADVLFDGLLQNVDDEILKLSDALTDAEKKYDELLLGLEQMITEQANMEALLAKLTAGEEELETLRIQLEDGIAKLMAALA
ncbi:MAG: hypothetical protein IJU80_08605, partial [Lachnospiraceae bacterium]|nr:hypothetical protein [Lachnospiraceae bacterium]